MTSDTVSKCPYSPIPAIREDKNHPGWGSCRTCTGAETCHTRFMEDFHPEPNHVWEAKATFEYAVMTWRLETPEWQPGTRRWWLTVWAGGHEFTTSCNENPEDRKLDTHGVLAEQYAKERALMAMIQELSRHLMAAVDASHGINSQTLTILRRKSGAWG